MMVVCIAAEDVEIFSDKSGDVYKCQLSDPEAKPQLILGHISMVLDMVWSKFSCITLML